MPSNTFMQKIPFLLLILIGGAWSFYSLQFLNQGIFWDLGIYEKAVNVYLQGGNPYELNGYLSFVYHPIVLRLMSIFGGHLNTVLIGFYILSIVFFLKSINSNRSWWLYIFLAFAYCGIGTISIGSGNVTIFFHLILLGILLGSVEKNNQTYWRKSLFWLSVTTIIFSFVKPYMLAYLLIPLISSWKTPQQKSIWSLTLLLAILFALIMGCGALYFGAEFQSFLNAVQGQTIGKRDLGYGIVMYFYEYYLSASTLLYRAFVLHFVILAAIFSLTLVMVNRAKMVNLPRFALLLYFLLTILNPRLKVYDLFPALIALFIFFSFYQTSFNRWIFLMAYAISLSQLAGTALFANSGILSDPLNAYYLTMGLVFIVAMNGFLTTPISPNKVQGL